MQSSGVIKSSLCVGFSLLGMWASTAWAASSKTQMWPDLGPFVHVFDASMPASEIQHTVDHIYQQQEADQFGSQRYALLFKPGHYQTLVKTGFYTQVLGLGQHPDAVTLEGGLYVDAVWHKGDGTQNFWRGAENLAVIPKAVSSARGKVEDGTMQWAVSQASPLRRLHIKGHLILDDNSGWTSGGFLADSWVDGEINAGTQQQWLSRNSDWGRWNGARWNMVFVGSGHSPDASHWPEPSNTVITHTPRIREKPYLAVNQDGELQVMRPRLRHHSVGISWQQTSTAQALPISRFYIARPEKDTARSLNAALNRGQHLLLTPGIYSLQQPIKVQRANTIVLGLGLATLQAVNGNSLMEVADVDGVSIAGLLLDAGEQRSKHLMRVGEHTSPRRHQHNPTLLHDVFIRIGGSGVANADLALAINSQDVIGDNLWLWRADHGSGVGWDVNHTRNGLLVNGDHVTLYGLFVEHFHEYQTVWVGNHGRVYFYQSEAPYEAPDQASWMNDSKNGYASYKVANHVKSHHAYGLGIYCWFDDNPQVKLHSAIEAPVRRSVVFQDMTTVSLGGKGEITHVWNNLGARADDQNNVVKLKSP